MIQGRTTALTGKASEIQMTAAINHYIGNWGELKTVNPHKVAIDFPPVKLEPHFVEELGLPEIGRIAFDANYTSIDIVNYVENNIGTILKATHVGNQNQKGDSSDIILEVDANGELKKYRLLGASLKYSKSKHPAGDIKMFSPSAQTFCGILADYYLIGLGQPSNLIREFKILQKDMRGYYDDLYEQYHDWLADVYGIDCPKKLPGASSVACYRPYDKAQTLNDGALSYMRRMNENNVPRAVEFYKKLNEYNLSFKKAQAVFYHKTLKDIFDQSPKEVRNECFRTLVNIPELTDDDIDTILVSTTRSKNAVGRPTIEIIHAGRAVEKYIEKDFFLFNDFQEGDVTCFNIGPARICVDSRPGSVTKGSINISLNKKMLREGTL